MNGQNSFSVARMFVAVAAFVSGIWKQYFVMWFGNRRNDARARLHWGIPMVGASVTWSASIAMILGWLCGHLNVGWLHVLAMAGISVVLGVLSLGFPIHLKEHGLYPRYIGRERIIANLKFGYSASFFAGLSVAFGLLIGRMVAEGELLGISISALAYVAIGFSMLLIDYQPEEVRYSEKDPAYVPLNDRFTGWYLDKVGVASDRLMVPDKFMLVFGLGAGVFIATLECMVLVKLAAPGEVAWWHAALLVVGLTTMLVSINAVAYMGDQFTLGDDELFWGAIGMTAGLAFVNVVFGWPVLLILAIFMGCAVVDCWLLVRESDTRMPAVAMSEAASLRCNNCGQVLSQYDLTEYIPTNGVCPHCGTDLTV